MQLLKWRCLAVTGIPFAHRCVPSPVHSCPSSRSGCKWLLQCATARGTGSAKDPELPVLVETIHATSGASFEGYCWLKPCTGLEVVYVIVSHSAVLWTGGAGCDQPSNITFISRPFHYVCKKRDQGRKKTMSHTLLKSVTKSLGRCKT